MKYAVTVQCDDWRRSVCESLALGDWVLLRAFVDLLAVISACPQEWNPAANYHPSALLARILVAR